MVAQSPMISVPLKATTEIDWVAPLKKYIAQTYGDNPERYSEECITLNRLRQDTQGAGGDGATSRDILYRYYGQLELLDLRFPVDEKNIKILFTWYDAFTHNSTSQYSLAFEKASIIFNISAVLASHAAQQNRSEESGLKLAYHSFQASAGMFTYINENFLHAPSIDLSRDTVKTLINIMLAQATEVFLERQIRDQKKNGMLAKLSSQTSYLYGQSLEGIQDNVGKGIFDRSWLLMVQVKHDLLGSQAQFFQALADDDANNHGVAVGRLQVAERMAKDALRSASSFPTSIPSNAKLSADCGSMLSDMVKRHLSTVQDRLAEISKDNDYIYHQIVPSEASLTPVTKLPAAKPIPVTELYAGKDLQRITGPDLFSKIVPMDVTESASLYDEEKAKLVRAETEHVDIANSEMVASLDYLRLPSALEVLKGGFDQNISPDEDFRTWCEDVAGHENPMSIFDSLHSQKASIIAILDRCKKELDKEESVCEKMRSKHQAEWTQQPSAQLTTTLRNDIRSYREALDNASKTDNQLAAALRQNKAEFDEMRHAADKNEVDALFRQTIQKVQAKASGTGTPEEPNLLDADFDDGKPSAAEQIAKVEEFLKKLNLIRRERNQVLSDLKEKVHNDDISQILILNKKSVANSESQLFQAELEKFRPYQTRILQANQKQATLMKELTVTFNALLQDKRVRAEHTKYEAMQKHRAVVTKRYKRTYQAFLDLESGLQGARSWYAEMKQTVDNLEKNVVSFVESRRQEGLQLLTKIDQARVSSSRKSEQAELERERLRELMDRMSVKTPPGATPMLSQRKSSSSDEKAIGRRIPPPLFQTGQAPRYQDETVRAPGSAGFNSYPSPPNTAGFVSPAAYDPSHFARSPPLNNQPVQHQISYGGVTGYRSAATSPLPTQLVFNPPSTYGNPTGYGTAAPPMQQQQQPPQHHLSGPQQQVPPSGFVPPPPPPGPPPIGPQQTFHYGGQEKTAAPATDPWAGLNAWK